MWGVAQEREPPAAAAATLDGLLRQREQNVSAGSAQSAHARAPQGGGRTPFALQ